MRQVSSSSVEAIGYDKRARRLFIRFRGTGHTYAYEDVDRDVFEALRSAPSIGRFVNSEIKERYRFEPVS